MATNFPSSVDSFPDPSATDRLDNPPHDVLHTNVNSAVEAIETALLDGAPLHIDDTNERVGVGTTTPSTELEVDGTVTATEFVGHLQGPTHIQVKNTSGGSLSKGTPVYATGSVGASGAVEVQASLAGTASTMPALGLLDETLAHNDVGSATVIGVIRQVDTSSYSVNDELYVAVSGGLTATRPSGASELVQKIGRVVRSDASTGEILVLGAGRSNDVPNNIVAGGLTIDTDTLHVDATNDRVGVGTTAPGAPLEVADNINAVVYFNDTAGTQGADLNAKLWFQGSGVNSGVVGFNNTTQGIMVVTNQDGSLQLTTKTDDSLLLRTNDSTRVTVTGGGDVGIGTTSPSSKLEVAGGINAVDASQFRVDPSDATYIKIGNGYSSNDVLQVDSLGGIDFVIDRNANSSGKQFRWLTNGDAGAGTPIMVLTDNGSAQIHSWAGTATSPSETDDWPTPTLALRNYDNFGTLNMLSFGYPNDSIYQTGGSVWSFRLSGSTNAKSSSSSTNLQLVGPGVLDINSGIDVSGGASINSNNGSSPFYVTRGGASNEAFGMKVLDRDGYIFFNQDETSGASYIHIDNNGASGSTKRTYFNCNIHVPNVVKSGTSNFQINHPLPEMSQSHWLIHTGIEAPNADNLYRGEVSLVDGTASVNLDNEGRMTEGTFVALNRRVQCFTTNETDWGAVKGVVDGNILTITAQDSTSTATVSWMVIGERKDQGIYESDRSDSEGRALVEVEQDDPSVAPRTWEEAHIETLETA